MNNLRVAPLLCSLGLFLLLPGFCGAQVVDPVTAAQAPVPGAGHHYVGIGSETVNPADGSVTFELPIGTPAGRELSESSNLCRALEYTLVA